MIRTPNLNHLAIWLLLTLLAIPALNAQIPLKHRSGKHFVVASSGLNMRTTPELGGALVTKIPYAQEVEIIAERKYVKVGWMEGYWSEIRYQGKTGYVFSCYLSRIPVPSTTKWTPADCKQQQAFGYEPFLRNFIKDKLTPLGEEVELYESPQYPNEPTEESYRHVRKRVYNYQCEVVSQTHYESWGTLLRVPGADVYQAYAWLEALMQVCEDAKAQVKKPEILKDGDYGDIRKIQDAKWKGGLFEIKMIDIGTVQITMGAGV